MNDRTTSIPVGGPLRLALVLALIAVPSRSSGTRVHRPPTAPRGSETRGASCTATLVVRATEGAGGCFIDERVTARPGTLHHACGDGPAEAVFGASRFVGRVERGAVDVTLRTRFHFSDGCDWESTQRITGRLADRRLDYSYVEAPAAGQARCASACRARASVAVR